MQSVIEEYIFSSASKADKDALKALFPASLLSQVSSGSKSTTQILSKTELASTMRSLFLVLSSRFESDDYRMTLFSRSSTQHI